MARKTVLVSDLSDQEIPNGQYVHISVTDGSNRYDLDASNSDPLVAELMAKGRKSRKRGAKKKVA